MDRHVIAKVLLTAALLAGATGGGAPGDDSGPRIPIDHVILDATSGAPGTAPSCREGDDSAHRNGRSVGHDDVTFRRGLATRSVGEIVLGNPRKALPTDSMNVPNLTRTSPQWTSREPPSDSLRVSRDRVLLRSYWNLVPNLFRSYDSSKPLNLICGSVRLSITTRLATTKGTAPRKSCALWASSAKLVPLGGLHSILQDHS